MKYLDDVKLIPIILHNFEPINLNTLLSFHVFAVGRSGNSENSDLIGVYGQIEMKNKTGLPVSRKFGNHRE